MKIPTQIKPPDSAGQTGGSHHAIFISDIKAEEYYITILDNILLAFKAKLTSLLYMGFRAILDKIINALDFSLDESLLEISMYDTSTLRSL